MNWIRRDSYPTWNQYNEEGEGNKGILNKPYDPITTT